MSESGVAAPKTITIRQGDEYRAKEGSIYITNDIFHENFSEAAQILGEILRHSDCYLRLHRAEVANYLQIDSGTLLGYPNNIIAFCAERGHGKTSAMVTFAKALQNLSENEGGKKDSFWDFALEKAGDEGESEEEKRQGLVWMKEHSFRILTRIDPTTMGKNDSILRVMLVRMYSDFIEFAQKEEPHKGLSGNRQDIDRLQEDFQKCLRIIRQMMSEKIFDEDVDDLEQIWNQQDVTNLCWQLYRLIREYLAFRTGSKNGVLVLQIDDVDLSTGRAHRILEDIRRYLFVPQVVVLLAVDMSQLEGAVEQNFIKEFSDSLRNHGIVGLDDCHDMMERYLDKLLPSTKQVHLVNANDEIKRSYHGLQIRYLRRDATDKEDEATANLLIKYLHLEKGDPKLKWGYQEQLLHLLYRKTGMVFLAPEYLHNLLPRTMRELTHFLAYFYPMPDFTYNEDIVTKGNGYEKMLDDDTVDQRLYWGKNIARFKHYLLHAWACINLQESEHTFLLKLDKTADVNKNLMVLEFLPEYYGIVMSSGNVVREVSTKKAEEYRKEFCDACGAHDIYLDEHLNRGWATYANVCEALNILSETPGSSRLYSLIYAVHLYYSIRLHELMLSEKPLRQRWQDVQVIMGSTLFNPHRLPERSIFGQMNSFEIRVGDLRTVIEQAGNGGNILLWNQITAWCREIVPGSDGPGKCSYRMLADSGKLTLRGSAIPDDERLGDDQILSFDIFAPFFHEFETITLSDISEKQANLASALSILLNWDVQYCIQRNLKAQKSSLLKQYAKNVYKSIQSGTDNEPSPGDRFASANYIPSLLRNAPIPSIEEFLSDETADVLFWSGKRSAYIDVLRKKRNQTSREMEAWKADLIRYGGPLKQFLSAEEDEELEKLSKDNFDKVFGSPESPNTLADIRKELQTLSKKRTTKIKQPPVSSKTSDSSQEEPLSPSDSSGQNESST